MLAKGSMSNWIMGELVPVYHNLTTAQAQRLVDELKLHELAAQITWPFPSLLQLASEFTEPTSAVHPLPEVPLNSLTMIVDVPLRMAHTTWLVETSANDGVRWQCRSK